MCGLEVYADAVIGSLSVEHRKRTTIGVELAAKVRVLVSFFFLLLTVFHPAQASLVPR
jgi:hypothetical protein